MPTQQTDHAAASDARPAGSTASTASSVSSDGGRQDAARQKPLAFTAKDAFPLSGTLFEGNGNGPLVLISSATAVPQSFYAGFAQALVEAGARAVLTYDYRATGSSPRPRGWRKRINYKDWALFDFPAALAALEATAPGHPVVGIGQSYGGHALGLSGVSGHFQRYAMVASITAWFGNLDDPGVGPRMNMVGVPVSYLYRDTPRWLGIGEPIPSSCLRDWARWCRMRHYFFDDPHLPETARFADVRLPVLAIGLTDDRWGTSRGMDDFLSRHTNAAIEQRWLSPQEGGGAPIGHLGFFRSRFSQSLWPSVIGWLLKGEPMTIGAPG